MSSQAYQWLKDHIAPPLAIALIPTVIVLGVIVWYRIPDLEKKLEQYRNDQITRASEWEKSHSEQLKNIEAQLVGVRTNLLRLCSKGGRIERNCEIREIVSTASQVSSFQAKSLASATIANLDGQLPKVASKSTEAVLEGFLKFPTTESTTDNRQIASTLVWTSAAKNAHWKVLDGALRVDYDNGSAVFQPESGISPLSLSLAAQSLNDISASFMQVGAATEDQEASTTEGGP